MEVIYSIQLTNFTLLLVFVIPFIYFGYQTAYWYRPDFVKRLDILYMLASICLAGVIGMIMLKGPNSGDRDFMLLGLLHLAPLILAVLNTTYHRQIVSGRTPGRGAGRGTGKKGGKAPGEEGDYLPVPLNKEIEQISWDDLVIDDVLREELVSVITLLRDPKTADQYGVQIPKGILLYGPPGTGKTTIAKVIAKTAGLSFFALRANEVISKWVGESEKNLTTLFHAANRHRPSVIFIDEIDSIGKSRGSSGQSWADNLLNHLLQLVDGVVKQDGLYVIGATNRPDLVDDALKRAGRLEKALEIPLPNFEARQALFVLGFSKLQLDQSLDMATLAQITEGKSGADIKAICNQAGLNAFKRESGSKKRDYTVTAADVQNALNEFLYV